MPVEEWPGFLLPDCSVRELCPPVRGGQWPTEAPAGQALGNPAAGRGPVGCTVPPRGPLSRGGQERAGPLFPMTPSGPESVAQVTLRHSLHKEGDIASEKDTCLLRTCLPKHYLNPAP